MRSVLRSKSLCARK